MSSSKFKKKKKSWRVHKKLTFCLNFICFHRCALNFLNFPEFRFLGEMKRPVLEHHRGCSGIYQDSLGEPRIRFISSICESLWLLAKMERHTSAIPLKLIFGLHQVSHILKKTHNLSLQISFLQNWIYGLFWTGKEKPAVMEMVVKTKVFLFLQFLHAETTRRSGSRTFWLRLPQIRTVRKLSGKV